MVNETWIAKGAQKKKNFPTGMIKKDQ